MSAYQFLLVDDDEENRRDIARTLLIQFPGAIVQQCAVGSTAQITIGEETDAVIVHQIAEAEALALTSALRKTNATIPLLFVSTANCAKEAVLSGATRYLSRAQVFLIGTVMVSLLATTPTRPPAKPPK